MDNIRVDGNSDVVRVIGDAVGIPLDELPEGPPWGVARTSTRLDNRTGRVNLEIEHLPTKDMLWFCVDGDRICVGEMLPDGIVSWEVEPRTRHMVCYEHTSLFEVPADGQKHLIVISFEKGDAVKACLDGSVVHQQGEPKGHTGRDGHES